jgi:hypothetical protein
MIDFLNSPALTTNQDVILHLSIRPKENAIVRNHFQNGKWGAEERDGPCARSNESFEMIISAEREFYKLTINGQYLGSFRHRLPLHLVQFINVSGKVTIDHILIEQDMSAFQQQQPQQMNVNQFPSPMVPHQQMQMSTNQYASPSVPPGPQLMVSSESQD